jgi:cytochrome c oxidase cbb3-type subunit 3
VSDFINDFWNAYVVVLVIASLLFCVFIILSNRGARPTGTVELHGHQWDETLAEWNNPLPRWWVWLFWITIVFAVVYLAAYPGLGRFDGMLKWTSVNAMSAKSALPMPRSLRCSSVTPRWTPRQSPPILMRAPWASAST